MIFVLSSLRCMAARAEVFPTSGIIFISVPSIPLSCVYSTVCKLMSGFLFLGVFGISQKVLLGVQSSIYLAVQIPSEGDVLLRMSCLR